MDIALAQGAEAATSPPDSHPTMMVLLVDDQPMIGEIVRRVLLDDPNIEFHYCADGGRAIALAREIKPTVILQDLVMPGVDGLDLVRGYRADPSIGRTPIIVLSTKEEAKVKSEAFRAGASDYLVKLPDQIELLARIRYHSAAYLHRLQRDEAYRALRQSQQQLMETNLELQRLTNVDGLTGLSNRRYFDEYMNKEWRRAIRAAAPFALLLIDIDYFKQYNDTYGHLAGDEVLKAVAGAIQICCRRANDLAARFGGEEFVVALPGPPLADAALLGETLRAAVQALRLEHSGAATAPSVTVSIGVVSTVPGLDESFLPFIEAADRALYAAKHSGRNRVVVGHYP
jgi:two-component system, chemotaxis family, response regulator WspR